MALSEIKTQSVSTQVYDQLLAEILGGQLKPGEPLPSERALTELFGVNRHAIREAIKRLEQAGLLQVSHGGATRVLDFRQHGGLDLVTQLVFGPDGLLDAAVVRSALEMRVAIGADAARMCAERATPELRAEILKVVDEMDRCAAGELALGALDHRFWVLLVDGSENIAYRLAFNSLITGMGESWDDTSQLRAYELAASNNRRTIAAAIAAQDAAAAEANTREVLTVGLNEAMRVLAEYANDAVTDIATKRKVSAA